MTGNAHQRHYHGPQPVHRRARCTTALRVDGRTVQPGDVLPYRMLAADRLGRRHRVSFGGVPVVLTHEEFGKHFEVIR